MNQFLLILPLALLLGQAAMAQLPERVRHINELFLIENGTDLFIKGGLEHLEGNDDNIILNQGDIHVGDSVVNHAEIYLFGTLPDTLGHVYLRGNNTQGIGGNPMYFSNLSLRNSYDSLELNADTVAVTNFLNLDSGNVLLNGNQLYLPRITYAGSIIEGTLVGEDNDDNVYGYPGFVRLHRPLNTGATYSDLHGTGLDLKNEGNLGSLIELRRYHTEQTASNGSLTRYFQIYPTINDDVSNVNIRYIDPNDLNGNNEDSIHLYLSTDNGLSWRDKAGTPNSGQNKVSNTELFPVSNLSRFTLSEDTCDSPPAVDIALDTIPLCNDQQAVVSASGISSFDVYWSTGEANQDSIVVTTPGTYWVRVIDPQGCINFDSAVVVSAPDPVVGFTHNFPCQGDTTTFNDTSSISDGSLSYSWNFGSPFTTADTSSQQHPTYKYSQAGTYSVTLTVTSSAGCSKSKSKNVVVLPYPSATFTAASVCSGAAVSFTNSSTVAGSGGLTYLWLFADGDSSISAAPTHTYDTAGTFAVSLIATSNGCSDTAVENIVIYPLPQAQFSASNACLGTQTQLTNTSTGSGNLSYFWQLGNGTTTTALSPVLTYSSAGQYAISLGVTTANGCQNAFTDTVIIHPVPTSSFTHTNACALDSASFTNSSSISSGSISTYTWSFGDGNTATSANTSHTYSTAGSYTVSLTATSDSGCTDEFTQVVTAYPLPTASFNANDVCLGDPTAFQNGSSIASGSLTYSWAFSATDSAFTTNPSFTFNTDGTFNVWLGAVSNQGCEQSVQQSVTVFPLPLVDLGADTLGTCGDQLTLDAANSGSSFAWSNGSNSQSITALFNGFYGVTVTDGNGCTQNDQTYVSLMSEVSPNLGPNVTVCDSVLIASGFPAANNLFVWNNGATTNNQWITTSGQYAVTVTDQNNCEGADTVDVVVNSSPVVDLGADQVACIGNTITFDAQNSGNQFLWSNGATSQSIEVSTGGNYFVSVTNAFNCTTSDFAHATFQPIPNFSLGPDTEACDSVLMSAQTPNATYTWSTGATSSAVSIAQSGSYNCTVSLANGCSRTDTVNITIHASPVVYLGADTVLCSTASYVIDAQNPGSSYLWSDGSTGQTLAPPTSGSYGVTVTGTGNCQADDEIQVTRNATLEVNAGDDFILCDGASQRISADVLGGTYLWGSPAGFFANTRTATVADTGIYWVRVTDQFGCIGHDTVQANATNASLNASFLARTSLSLGDTIKFVNLSYPEGYTSFWNMGDGFTTTEDSPEHPYFVSDNYTVSLAVSNGVCSDTIVKEISISQLKYEAATREYGALYEGFVSSKLYPNPNQSSFTVELQLMESATVYMDVFTIAGVLIDSKQASGQSIKQDFNYHRLTPGIYLLRCHNGKASQTLKFVVID